MHDQYQPSPITTAVCPHCGAIVDGAPGAHPCLLLATLRWRCACCGLVWQEIRAGQHAERYWEASVLSGPSWANRSASAAR